MIFAVICGIIVVIAVIGLINSLNKNKAIDNKPEFAKEKALKEFLTTFTTRLHITRKPRRSYENGNAYYADFRKNGEYFAQLLDKGAKMVFVSGSNPDHPQSSPIHIYALTPKMILHKEDHYRYSDKEKDIVTSQNANLATIYTHKYEVFSHGTKNASVTGRAAAGSVLGGAAGAVIGAASAAETNKNGGVAHHTLTDTQNYMVSFTGPGSKVPHIDGILLNNELKAKLEANPEVMACIKEQNGNYIRMPGIITALGTAKEAAVLAAWLNENILNKA